LSAQIILDLSKLPGDTLLAIVVAGALLVLLIPLSLRLAGLTGQQIADVLALTLRFFLNLVSEFRAQNKTPPSQ